MSELKTHILQLKEKLQDKTDEIEEMKLKQKQEPTPERLNRINKKETRLKKMKINQKKKQTSLDNKCARTNVMRNCGCACLSEV